MKIIPHFTTIDEAVESATARYMADKQHHFQVNQKPGAGYYTVGIYRESTRDGPLWARAGQTAWSTVSLTKDDIGAKEGRRRAHKLDVADIHMIYELLAEGLTYLEVADKFEVHKRTILNIVNGKGDSYPNVRDFLKQQRATRRQEKK